MSVSESTLLEVFRRCPKPLVAGVLSVFLGACSNSPTKDEEEFSPVGAPFSVQERDGHCGVSTERIQRYKNESDEEKLVRLSKSYELSEGCFDWDVLTVVAKAAKDPLSAAAVLLGLSGKNSAVRSALQEALKRNDISEKQLYEIVAANDIQQRVSGLREGASRSLDMVAVSGLLALYDQDRLPQGQRLYPELDMGVLRGIIDQKLAEAGLNIQALQKAYLAAYGCQLIEVEEGEGRMRTTCGAGSFDNAPAP